MKKDNPTGSDEKGTGCGQGTASGMWQGQLTTLLNQLPADAHGKLWVPTTHTGPEEALDSWLLQEFGDLESEPVDDREFLSASAFQIRKRF